MQRKVLVVGSGGREHALALRLLDSPSVREVVVTPGNAGTRGMGQSPKSLRSLAGSPVEIAQAERVDWVVVGPEAPLAAGLVDELGRLGILAFGPTAKAARLESSKSFMKDFASRHGIPTPHYVTVREPGDLKSALSKFREAPVVKADGLCAGKGVVVADSHEQAQRAAADMLTGRSFGDAGRTVVLEDRIRGTEASVHALCDGERTLILPVAQDHKRIGEGDTGPNTGGMGAYAPAQLKQEHRRFIIEEIIARAVHGMAAEGSPFRGTLFAGLMLPPTGDPQLIEFNVRFGDPETQAILSVLDGDLAEALWQASSGRLEEGVLSASQRHAVCVVLASAGYPGSPRLGDRVDGLEQAAKVDGVEVYHAGTALENGRVVTAGGRVFGVTGRGDSFAEAHRRAYEAAAKIQFAGMQLRRDIGRPILESPRP